MVNFNSKQFNRLLGGILALLMLSACQTGPQLQKIPTSGDWQDNPAVFSERQMLADAEQWSLRAKVGIKSETLSESANLVWQFNRGQHSLRLFGPLGAGTVRIDYDDSGVVLTDNRGQTHQGDNAQDLLSEITGWTIPIDALQYWFFVLPQPRYAYRYKLNNGRPNVLQQLGWRIEYSNYLRYESDLPNLPKKIIATQSAVDASQSKPAVVRLVVKSWVFGDGN